MTVPMDMTWSAQLVSVSMTANFPIFVLLGWSLGIVYRKNAGFAMGLYASLGIEEAGAIDHEEIVAVLKL